MARRRCSAICVAVIWTAVILAATTMLYDTPYLGQMLVILGGGAAADIIITGSVRREEERQ